MRSVFLPLVFLIIFLYGCQSNTITFIGEGESWSAEVDVHHQLGKESEDVVLKYNGEDVDSVGSFKYFIDAPSWGTGRDGAELNKAAIFTVEGVSLNDKKTSADAKLTITIEWNNKSETFELTNTK